MKFYNNIDKEKFKLSIKILSLSFVLILILFLIPTSLSKYNSKTNSKAEAEIAFFLLNADYHTENVLLGEIVPRTEPYVYNFDISNNKKGKRVETNLKYDLKIRTTTNLPLNYELYINQEYTESGAQNALTLDRTATDDDGTYFNYFTTDTKYFSYLYDEINHYQLVVYFPANYIESKYQDIYDSIEISIEAKQVIPGDS